jgi:hypothetical protein
MSSSFSYSTTFVLDRAHFNECFSNSVVVEPRLVAYRKAIIFTLIGLLLALFTDVNAYIVYFVMGLGFIEALSSRYRQAWWVTRQMLGRTSNTEVTLSMDDDGIHTHSPYLNSVILWSDISAVNTTENGLIVVHSKGRSYLSDSCLSAEAKAFLAEKV